MAAIGEPEKEIQVEPIEWPTEAPVPVEPSPVAVPEPVPA